MSQGGFWKEERKNLGGGYFEYCRDLGLVRDGMGWVVWVWVCALTLLYE